MIFSVSSDKKKKMPTFTLPRVTIQIPLRRIYPVWFIYRFFFARALFTGISLMETKSVLFFSRTEMYVCIYRNLRIRGVLFRRDPINVTIRFRVYLT